MVGLLLAGCRRVVGRVGFCLVGLSSLCADAVEIPAERYYHSDSAKSLIYPFPKEYQETGQLWQLSDELVIVLGEQHSVVERFAAKRFQALSAKVSGKSYPIVTESEIPSGAKQIVLLGQRDSSTEVNRLCDKFGIQLSDTMPNGFAAEFSDGFVIEMLEEGERQIILIGGSNERGVIYGQDACYDLLFAEGGSAYLPVVKVRDWPTVEIRSFLAFSLDYYDHVGYDGLIRSRYNQVNIGARDFKNGFSLRQVYNRFLEMGISVWAGVGGAIPASAHDGQLDNLRHALSAGAEGIYISFDDKGMGEKPLEYLEKVIALGDEFGIPMDNYSTTTLPYNELPSTNASIANLIEHFPEFKQASFTITNPPSKEVYDDYQQVGIKWKYWYNWPMGTEYNPVLESGQNYLTGYRMVPKITNGWGSPDYDTFRGMATYTPHTMFSLATTRDKSETSGYPFGMYAWDPAGVSKANIEQRVYAYLFGYPALPYLDAFHDGLRELSKQFESEFGGGRHRLIVYRSPTYLKDVAKRPEVLELIETLQNDFSKIAASARAHSSLKDERLETYYLRPIGFTLESYKRLALADFPEYHVDLDEVQKQVWKLLETEDDDAAQAYLDAQFGKVDAQLKHLQREMADMAQMWVYVQSWQTQRTLKYWKEQIEKSQKGYTVRVRRDAGGKIHVTRKDTKSSHDIYYTIDGTRPSAHTNCFRYYNPYPQVTPNLMFKAAIYDAANDRHGSVIERPFGMLKNDWRILESPVMENPEHIIDDDWNTYSMSDPSVDYWATGDKQNRPEQEPPYEFVIDLGKAVDVASIGIMPAVSFDPKPINPEFGSATLRGSPAKAMVSLSADGREWFAETEVDFSYSLPRWFQEDLAHRLYHRIPLSGNARYLKLVFPSVIANVNCMSLSEVDVFTE